MEKKSLIMLVAIMLAVSLNACSNVWVRGSGDLTTEVRSVRDFTKIDLVGSGDVIITQTGEESLAVETDDNIMNHISTEVRGDTLYLSLESTVGSISPTRLRFWLSVDELESIENSGSGDIAVKALDTDHLDIEINGSGDVTVTALTAETVDVDISGSGAVETAGTSTQQDISINGSGKYVASNLQSEIVEVDINGSAAVTVWATESLDAQIYGSGDVVYYGAPSVSSSGSGSGKVVHRGHK
ncbi:MAG: head GIN domain-containing protein [Chloroflexota bacterium]